MLAFKDSTRASEGASTSRMNFRTKESIKATIQRAAALSGVDDSSFTMSAALREAQRTIAAHDRTVLEPVDHLAFFAALDASSEPTEALSAAAERYRSRTSPL